jgi:hypothetical protein
MAENSWLWGTICAGWQVSEYHAREITANLVIKVSSCVHSFLTLFDSFILSFFPPITKILELIIALQNNVHFA